MELDDIKDALQATAEAFALIRGGIVSASHYYENYLFFGVEGDAACYYATYTDPDKQATSSNPQSFPPFDDYGIAPVSCLRVMRAGHVPAKIVAGLLASK